MLCLREGDGFRPVATHGLPPAYVEERQREPLIRPAPRMTALSRLARTKQVVHIADLTGRIRHITGDPPLSAGGCGGGRTLLVVPMLKDDELIGAIAIYRQEVRPFTDKQIELVQNFAAQAVIAIENTRLLNELRQTICIAEQQTATSEVLQVISSSPGELEPVFQAMLENATRICEAKFGTLWRFEDGAARIVSQLGYPPAFAEFLQRGSHRPGPLNPLTRVVETLDIVHIADYRADRSYLDGDPLAVAGVELGGIRTLLVVPMLKDERADRCDRHIPPGGSTVHRQADRAGHELRRAGRHRHREHAAAQRAAPAHRRSERVAGAADRDLRGAASHLQLAR